MAPTIPNPADPKAMELFYEVVILEKALTTATRKQGVGYAESFALQPDPLLSSEQAFQSFLNKLAQICDNKRGGSTVTAFVVVRNPHDNSPIYVFGSNARTSNDLSKTKSFVEIILDLVGRNPHGLRGKALVKKTLWHILSFNILRVEAYLRGIVRYLNECIRDCSGRRGSGEPSDFERQLLQLQTRTMFPMDMSTNNAKQKFLSDCETLIKAIHANMKRLVDQAIIAHGKGTIGSSLEHWLELKHYLGRLHSYRLAAETIVTSIQHWPSLYRGFRVIPVLSSRQTLKPLLHDSLTAADIIQRMCEEGEDPSEYLLQAEQMQKIGLDHEVKEQISKTKPIVHAEILVHNELLRCGVSQPEDFWRGYKYIGTSKPTCRLCSYYFDAHPDQMKVRPSHLNLYPNWRLPDITEERDSGASLEQHKMLQSLTRAARSDVKRTLQEKCPRGKKHDSNTYSGRPGYLDLGDLSSMDGYEKAERYLEKQKESEWETPGDSSVDLRGDGGNGGLLTFSQ